MAALRFVRTVWSAFLAESGLEPRLLNNLQITDARPGSVKLLFDVQKYQTVCLAISCPGEGYNLIMTVQNRLGTLHGGTMASIVDLGGSLAVASHGLYATGVSTDINISYLSPAGKPGDKVWAEVTCDRFGKTLAYTSTRFTNEEELLLARGSHTKFIAQAWKDERNRVEEIRASKAGS